MINRRRLLTGVAALATYRTFPAWSATGQIWGAIRWDAWWASAAGALQAQANLWPTQWQFRAPSWATVVSPYKLLYPISQAVMDGEITAGNAAKLQYWAYVYYPAGDPGVSFMNGLTFHRSSSIRTEMNYCLIVQLGHWGGTTGYSAINAAITAFAQDTFYQKVNNKPVIFIDWDGGAFASQYGSNNANVATSVADLRSQMVTAGLTTPYIALMKFNDHATMTAIGADALSNYAAFPTAPAANLSYTSFDTQVQAQWASQLATTANVVPTAMTGWNPRPRIQQPPSFEPSILPWLGLNVVVVPGTNTQIANHVQAGVTLIANNSGQCPQKLGLIYSWDELDEGGSGLVPTIGDPTGTLLTAVGAVVA